MSDPDLVSLLENLIVSDQHLKSEDKSVVQKICRLLRIEHPELINDYHRQQVEAEAGIVYLKARYDSLAEKMREKIEQHKAGQFVVLGDRNDEGLKWTKASKEQWLLGTDAQYVVFLRIYKEKERLAGIMRELANVVFGRDRKLEQLSINLRREAEADRRTTF